MDVRVRVVQTDDRMRVEPPAQVEPPAPTERPYRLLLVAVVLGLSLGFVWGASQTSAVVPVASSDALATLVGDAGEDFAAPLSTTEPPVVFSISETPIAPVTGSRLNELVPGFSGSVTWQSSSGDVLKWRSGAVQPELLELPVGAFGQEWASRAARLAFIAGRNNVLYAGTADFEPRAVGVVSAAWHPFDMNRLAWIRDGERESEFQLMVSSFADGQTHEVAALSTAQQTARVVGWNDEGFAVLLTDDGGASQLVVFGEAGDEQLRVDDVVVDGARADGSIVLRSGTAPSTWWVLRLNGTSPEPLLGVPDGSPGGLAWSPFGESFVALDHNGLAWLVDDSGSVRVISGEVVDVAWSVASPFIVAVDRLGRLAFYNRHTAVTTLVDVDGSPSSLEAH